MIEKEREIQAAILTYLRVRRHFVWKQHNIGIKKPNGSYIPSNMLGVADILGGEKGTGRIIAIEVKRPGKKPSAAQEEFLENVRAVGGIGFVAYSVDDVIDNNL